MCFRFKNNLAWQTFFNDTTTANQGIFTLDSNHVWGVTAGGNVLYTNRGSEDTVHFAVDHLGDAFLVDVFATDEHHAWAIGNNGSLFRYGVLEGFPADEAEILDVTADYQVSPAQVDTANRTVSVLLGPDADLTQVFPEIYISAGATIDPPSGRMQDFSNPITYTVTSENQQIVNTWTITMSKTTMGLDDSLLEKPSLTIFPNPADEKLTVRWESPLKQPAKLSIHDIFGKLIFQADLQAGLGERELSPEAWPTGIYIVKLMTQDDQISKKLIIRH